MAISIRREEKGKPYFADLTGRGMEGKPKIHYSVSHSGNWWGCLMAEEQVGFDLEVYKETINHEKIAKRFFTEEEYSYILINGLDCFFDLWVRKEAYVKFFGTGIAEGLDSFSMIQDGSISPLVKTKYQPDCEQSLCYVRAYEIHNGVKAAYCTSTGHIIKQMVSLE